MKATTLAILGAMLSFIAVSVSANEPEELPLGWKEPIIIRRYVRVNESLPEIGARLYDQVDYELQLRQLNSDIKLATARLDAQRERVYVYDKYFHRTSALLITRQNARLAVLESELRLKQLRHEKLLMLRHRTDQVRYRKLLFSEGKVRLNLDE
jgi:hypothetical protein